MKKITCFAVLTVLLLVSTWMVASHDIAEDLSAGIVRLHILANSDAPKDQELKLKVRDRLLEEAGKTPTLLADSEIEKICKNVLAENGCKDSITVCRGQFYFPQKSYENLTLPAGTYQAVRILIGEGAGQNWWCVMFPPLCFTDKALGECDENAMETLKNTVAPETFSMITESDRITIKPSFKLVELWQEIRAKSEN